mmetsp:Transcript_47198/g.139230  ORF Transcript_47198/g.139230 Transcript_47198/m.139230 type:complete len:292 (-) Transcript_47198:2-877(-)
MLHERRLGAVGFQQLVRPVRRKARECHVLQTRRHVDAQLRVLLEPLRPLLDDDRRSVHHHDTREALAGGLLQRDVERGDRSLAEPGEEHLARRHAARQLLRLRDELLEARAALGEAGRFLSDELRHLVRVLVGEQRHEAHDIERPPGVADHRRGRLREDPHDLLRRERRLEIGQPRRDDGEVGVRGAEAVQHHADEVSCARAALHVGRDGHEAVVPAELLGTLRHARHGSCRLRRRRLELLLGLAGAGAQVVLIDAVGEREAALGDERLQLLEREGADVRVGRIGHGQRYW